MVSDGLRRRRRFFDEGAKAFLLARPDVIATHPELVGWYVCPLCLHALSDELLTTEPPGLTVDEAPPTASSRGPMAQVLTCQRCNNEAGRQLEGHLKQRRVAEDFAAGRLSDPTRVILEVADGVQTRAEATSAGGFVLTGTPDASNPVDVAANSAWWDEQVATQAPSPRFTIHLRAFNHRRAQLALLKAAYLAAFAAFGYTYICRPALDIVRDEIRQSGESGREGLAVAVVPDQDPLVHRIHVLAEPIRSLCLQIGQDFVLLPWLDSAADYWVKVKDLIGTGREVQFTSDQGRDWPRFPEYRLDLER